MKRLVLNSFKDALTEDNENSFKIEKFLLNTESENAPSNFEVNFIIEDKKYRYGFSLSIVTHTPRRTLGDHSDLIHHNAPARMNAGQAGSIVVKKKENLKLQSQASRYFFINSAGVTI